MPAATGTPLKPLKFQVLKELPEFPPVQSESEWRQHIDRIKYQVAEQIGVPLRPGYNGDLPSREAGAVGGRIGGRIGGQMVRHMITFAQQQMAANPGVLTTGQPPQLTGQIAGQFTGQLTGQPSWQLDGRPR